MQNTFDMPPVVAICAVNKPEILEACLKRSPDILSGELPLTTVEDARSMSTAYNEGMKRNGASVYVFVHQDVYLPQGWLRRLYTRMEELTALDPVWQVAGPYGVTPSGDHAGRVWDVTMNRELRSEAALPTRVGSLDELVIIVRADPDFTLDEQLPDFHLYGTDVCQTALGRGRSAWAIDAPVVHNNRPVVTLRGGYAKAYDYARRKWRKQLPITTTICRLSDLPFSLWRAQWRRRKVRDRPNYVSADAKAVAIAAGYE